MRRGDSLILTADRLDERGHGVGEHDERMVHVAGLAPGEQGRVTIQHISPHHPQAWAGLKERVGDESPDRVEPPCPAFGTCGGCAWQHICTDAQLQHKRRRVETALADALGRAPEVAEVVAAPSAIGYRNRGKYVVGMHDRSMVLGAYRPKTHQVVDTLGCLVVEDVVGIQAARIRGHFASSGLPRYVESQRSGVLRYAVVRSGADGGTLLVLVTTSAADRGAVAEMAAGLAADPRVTGVVWMRNDKQTGALLSDDLELLEGRGTVLERFAGVDVQVGPRAFVQVNRAAAAVVYAAIGEAIGDAASVLDLYCGVGAIGFHAAAAGARVVGIDSNAEAITIAREAAAGRDDIRFECADAGAVDELLSQTRFDIAVVNPPRKGLSAATRKRLLTHPSERLIYLSCSPESLSRDLADLVGGGYEIRSVQPFDLMPGTAQVETLVICDRGSR